MVTGRHSPVWWTAVEVRLYLALLDRLVAWLLVGDTDRFGKKSLLRQLGEGVGRVSRGYTGRGALV
jgi:hypothetical protein